jgi:hypothetical protein
VQITIVGLDKVLQALDISGRWVSAAQSARSPHHAGARPDRPPECRPGIVAASAPGGHAARGKPAVAATAVRRRAILLGRYRSGCLLCSGNEDPR